MSLQVNEELLSLVQVSELKHLLDHIVAKDVIHQFVRFLSVGNWTCEIINFIEESLLFLIIGFLQSLLNESRALLV